MRNPVSAGRIDLFFPSSNCTLMSWEMKEDLFEVLIEMAPFFINLLQFIKISKFIMVPFKLAFYLIMGKD